MNNVRPITCPVADLLPHTGSALLLDRLLGHGTDWVEAEVNHQQPSLYADNDGNVPSWAGIEYMVQTIGLFAGLEAKQKSNAVKPGFLLGTRSFNSTIDYFPAKTTIKVRAEMRFRDETNIVMFACTITDSKKNVLAEAEIKAIQPDNIYDILKEYLHA